MTRDTMKNIALKILKRLENHSYQSYIVGGYVRDYIMGIESTDVDITTSATPKQIKEVFPDVVLPKEDYGALTLYIKSYRYELVTFRKEYAYLDNRKPLKIEYITDIIEDLKRRDFTINTLCMDSNGEILDFLNAKQDIENKIIRAVQKDIDKEIKDDPLRILRAIRFASTLNFQLDKSLKEAIQRNKQYLKQVSYYRKKLELSLIFSAKYCLYGIELLKEFELEDILEISNIDKIFPGLDLLSIYSLIHFSNNYDFSRHEMSIIKAISSLLDKDIYDQHILYQYDPYIIALVAKIKKVNVKEILKIYEELPIKNIGDINFSYNDIMQLLKLPGSSKIRNIMKDIESAIIDNKIINTSESIERYLIDKYEK